MSIRRRGAPLSLLATLSAAVTVLAALSSLGGEWTAPPGAPLAVTPRGTVPLPPGVTPVTTAVPLLPPTPQGIAPAIGLPSPTPAPASLDRPQVNPAAGAGPAAGESSPAPPQPAATPGGRDAAPAAAPAPAAVTPASGFPAIIPSATAVTLSLSTPATLVAAGGDLVVSVAPDAGLTGAQLRYELQMPSADQRDAALDQGLLLTNIAFALAVERPGSAPQTSQAPLLGAALPLDIHVFYQPSQVSGIATDSLEVYRYDANQRTWQTLSSCVPAGEGRGLRCRAEGPGLFMVAGTRPVPLPGFQEQKSPAGTAWLLGGVGLALALGGAGWARWRLRPKTTAAGAP